MQVLFFLPRVVCMLFYERKEMNNMEQTIIIKAEKPVDCYHCRFCEMDEYDATCSLMNSCVNIVDIFSNALLEDCPFKTDGIVVHIEPRYLDED